MTSRLGGCESAPACIPMGLRHLGRELALKALYRIDICGGATDDDLALVFESFDARAREFALSLLEGVRGEQTILDKHLADVLEHWSIRRLSSVLVKATRSLAVGNRRANGPPGP